MLAKKLIGLLPKNWNLLFSGLAFLIGLTLLWQVRHTWHFASINGGYFEYGSLHIYLAQILLVVFVLLALVTKRIKWQLNDWEIVWLMWVGWQGISCIWSIDIAKSALMAGSWGLWLIGYLAFRDAEPIIKRWLFYGLAVSIIVLVGVAGWQWFANHSVGLKWLGEQPLDPAQSGITVIENTSGARQLRPYSLLPSPNILGGSVMILGLVVLGALGGNWWWIGVIVLIGWVLAFSRSAWLAGLLAGVWASSTKAIRPTMMKLGAVLLAIVAVGAIAYPNLLFTRFDASNRLEQISLSEHVSTFQTATEILKQNIWWGTGAGTSAQAGIRLDDKLPSYSYQPVHNIFFLLWIELGVVGIVIFARWLLLLIGSLWRKRDWSMMAPVIVWLVIGMFDHYPMSLYQGGALLWVCLIAIHNSEVKG